MGAKNAGDFYGPRQSYHIWRRTVGIDQSLQFSSKDGCVYVFNQIEKRWYKLCPTDVLPSDVKNQIKDLKEKADALAELEITHREGEPIEYTSKIAGNYRLDVKGDIWINGRSIHLNESSEDV